MHPTQTHVRAVLDSHHQPLCEMYDRAWEIYQNIPPEIRAIFGQNSRTVAGNVWSLVTYEAIRYFLPLDVAPRVRHTTIEFPVSQHVVLRFKKSDTSGATCNYPTRRAVAYDQGLPLPDVPERLRVNVGWVPNGNGTGIQDVLISLRGPAAWCYSISTNATGGIDLFEFVQDDDTGPIIRPRQDDVAADDEAAGGE
jgi:hypothetical protein